MKNLVLNTLFFLASLSLAVGVSEIGLRLFYYQSVYSPDFNHERSLRIPHPTRGWTLDANKSAWQQKIAYRVLVSINSRGLRDVEHTIEKESGTYRVAVFGDSYMEGYQLELEKTLPKLLETRIAARKVEVINFGVGGYGTTQQYLYLVEQGLKYRPDLVLVALYLGNDIRNNSKILERQLWQNDQPKVYARPFASLDDTGELKVSLPDYSRFVEAAKKDRKKMERQARTAGVFSDLVIYKLWSIARRSLTFERSNHVTYDPNVFFGPFLENFDPESYENSLSKEVYEQAWSEAWNVTRRLLSEMRDRSRDAEAEFAVFTVPAEYQYDQRLYGQVQAQFPRLKFDLAQASREILGGDSSDLHFIDLASPFRKIYDKGGGPLNYQLDDRHWNSEGHKVAADIVANYVNNHLLAGNRQQ